MPIQGYGHGTQCLFTEQDWPERSRVVDRGEVTFAVELCGVVLVYDAFIILAAVVTVVWWASMWAKDDTPKPPVDRGVDDDARPPAPKR